MKGIPRPTPRRRTIAELLKSTAFALSFSLSLGFAGPAVAQEAVAPETQVEADAATPALWKIADEDTTIYLFGTVHALPKDSGWYAGPIKAALDSSEVLVTEIDMAPEKLARVQGLVLEKGTLADGQTLRGLMTDEQRTQYEASLAKLGIPAEALDPFEPWLAIIQLTQVFVQAAGFSPDAGAETVLEGVTSDTIERVSLETPEFQIAIFDELPLESQIGQLLEALEDPRAGIALLGQLVEEWKLGNVDRLAAMIREASAVDPVMAARIFFDRNANWAVWIDERLDAPGTIFIAVGAGHLAGDNSVQDYLAERGIEAVRVQ